MQYSPDIMVATAFFAAAMAAHFARVALARRYRAAEDELERIVGSEHELRAAWERNEAWAMSVNGIAPGTDLSSLGPADQRTLASAVRKEIRREAGLPTISPYSIKAKCVPLTIMTTGWLFLAKGVIGL